jgi:GTP1/Obg family GTP-binding protein
MGRKWKIWNTMHSQAMRLMNSTENNATKTMSSKAYGRIISTINSYKEFEQTKDVMRHLKLTRNM